MKIGKREKSCRCNWRALAAIAVVGIGLGFAAPVQSQTAPAEGNSSVDLPTVDLPTQGVPSDVETDAAKEQPSVRERLTYLLSGYHFEADREQLEGLGESDEVTAALRELAKDDSIRPSLRQRAVDSLALFDDDQASVDFLKSLLENPEVALSEGDAHVRESLQHHAMTGLARALKEDAVPVLEPYLTHDDVQFQLTAVSALGEFAKEAAQPQLKQALERVERPFVREKIQKFVK